ncbi:MAG TPA: YggS family pyridoxal phosphate-dependent enzyme [Micromonosporaceae bacterium]
MTQDNQRRRAELARGLEATRERIASACAAVGRSPDEVTLVAVTKTYPAADVVLLADLGVVDIGENRDQEAAPKAAEVAAAGVSVRWHFVGQLQRNKCRSVVRYADVVHSVDSVRLARTLADAAARLRDRPLDVLVQVSIDGDERRGGALATGDAAALNAERAADRSLSATADAVADGSALRLRGVMAVAPLTWRPEDAFARLAEIAAELRAEHPEAAVVSAGMSADLDAAIRYGATHVRIGSALLGKRPRVG